jgi:AcrR family transcriptional regulator
MSREESAAEPVSAVASSTTEAQERSSPVASSPVASRQFSLRERKFARTKLALLQAALERMRGKKLDEIPVKELCDEVEISEATFFNYFPKKSDLLHYLIKVWTIEVAWQAKSVVGEECGLSFIEQVFDYTGKRLAEHPRLMLEIIAHMALEPHASACPKTNPELSLAEKLQAFPECAGVECVPELALPEVFRAPLERAVARGELPEKADIEAAVLGLLGIFFGVPLWLGPRESEQIRPAYHRQLKLLWAGLRCR